MTAELSRSTVSTATPVTTQRRRARRFWATVGVMQRFDDRRFTRTQVRLRSANDMQAVRVSARIFQGI